MLRKQFGEKITDNTSHGSLLETLVQKLKKLTKNWKQNCPFGKIKSNSETRHWEIRIERKAFLLWFFDVINYFIVPVSLCINLEDGISANVLLRSSNLTNLKVEHFVFVQ